MISGSGALLLQQALCGNSSKRELSDVEVFGQLLLMASPQLFFSIGTSPNLLHSFSFYHLN
jgi:hypothetical protein